MTAPVLAPSKIPVADVAAVLARLYPIESLLHVGFGAGRGELSFWKDMHPSKVVLIDAQQIDLNKHNLNGEVKVITAVVSAAGGLRDWTQSQLAAENSLLSFDAHCARWPHARGLTVETIQTQTLDGVVQTAGLKSPNWLIIDLHPASEVIQGAGALLDCLDVLILRTALHQVSDWPRGSFLSDATEFLGAYGLTLAHLYAVGDDRFGVAVYARDTYKEQTVTLLSSRDELAKGLESVNQQLASVENEKSEAVIAREALTQEKTALGAQIADLQVQIEAQATRTKTLESANEALNAIKLQLEAVNQNLQMENAALGQQTLEIERARDQTIASLQNEKARLFSAREGLMKDLELANQQLESVVREKAAFGVQIAELQAQIEAQNDRAKTLELSNQQLKASNQELINRQALFDEELVKAESQIELIKDLLLRDESRI